MGCGLHSPFPLWVIVSGEVIYDITCAMCNILDRIACIINDITDSITGVINRITDRIAYVVVPITVVCLITGGCSITGGLLSLFPALSFGVCVVLFALPASSELLPVVLPQAANVNMDATSSAVNKSFLVFFIKVTPLIRIKSISYTDNHNVTS